MQNLNYQKVPHLYTTIGPAQIGVYTDLESVKKLILKDKGIELPAGAGSSYSISMTDNAVRRAVFMEQTLNEPAETKNFNYGFRIEGKYKHPAYVDNSEYWKTGKFYGGTFPALTISGGAYSAANALDIDEAIIKQITEDTGISERKNGSIVRARKAYIVTDDDLTGNSTLTITNAAGTDVTITVTGDHSAGAANANLGHEINDEGTVHDEVKAYRLGAATFLIVGIEEGNVDFSVTAGTTTTVVSIGILLDSRFDDLLFDVQFDKNEWTKKGLNLTDISSSDAFAAAINCTVTVDGTTSAVQTAGTNIATVVTALNALTNVYALAHDGEILLATPDTINKLAVEFPAENAAGTAAYTTNCAVAYEASTEGAFSSMTSDDIFRLFANRDHAGDMRSAIRGYNVPADTEYLCYHIKSTQRHGAIHGASHTVGYESKISIFVPKDNVRSLKWEVANLAADTQTGDRTLRGMLIAWLA